MKTFPAPHVEILPSGLRVVRDDLLPGGTKRRALHVLMSDPALEYVYASPAYGFAQVAAAHAARDIGCRMRVFVAQRRALSPLTGHARSLGASISEVPFGYMPRVRAEAHDYFFKNPDARLLPFGMDDLEFIRELARIAQGAWTEDDAPAVVYCVAGSGVMTRALQMAWPNAQHYAVRVGSEPKAGNATVLHVPERFEQDSDYVPPFPSSLNYDAKVWRYLRDRTFDDAPGQRTLFWNVAGYV